MMLGFQIILKKSKSIPVVLPRYQNLRQIGLIAIQINKCRLLISLYYNCDYNRGVRRGALGACVSPGGSRMGGLIYKMILYYVGKKLQIWHWKANHFILFQYFSNIKRQLFHHFEFSLLKTSAITTLKYFWYSAQTNL